MILVIDNYDSFIYNIVQYIGEFYQDIKVYRNDEITLSDALTLYPDGIVISPGPGRPENAGIIVDLIKNCGDIPILGVCLGHQAIAYAYGGKVIGAKNILHGKSSIVQHNQKDIFANIMNPIKVIRYHSLVAEKETLPDNLEITAESDDGEIMGLKVKGKDIYGVQFHPESILTEEGKKIIKNFIEIIHKRREVRVTEKNFERIKFFIKKVSEKENLALNEAKEMMEYIMNGVATPSQIAAYLTALKLKGETSEEISGSAQSMYSVCTKVEINDDRLVDTCGSGGDNSCTFNISTASAFVVAGAGIPVAKHGNRSITSNSGSADVLEKLGINIQLSKEKVEECIKKFNFGFIFAPLYHTAMKYAMPTRKEIGIRTIFNILGPIVNPAGVKHHVMGVFSKNLLDIISQVFVALNHKHSLVIYGDGLDEANIETFTIVKDIKNGVINDFQLNPHDFNLSGKLENLKVKNADESARVIEAILKNEEKGDSLKAVILNAGLAIYSVKDVSLDEAFKIAKDSIENGYAYNVLQNLRNYCKNLNC